MRMRIARDDGGGEVPMSPLIDCVFLLLIFFLVTSMLKKWEKQIPITLPESTSSLSQQADEDVLVLGIDEKGNYYRDSGDMDQQGAIVYAKIDDLAVYLRDVMAEEGADQAIRVAADRETPVQRVINAVDILQIQGFERVEVRTRQHKQ